MENKELDFTCKELHNLLFRNIIRQASQPYNWLIAFVLWLSHSFTDPFHFTSFGLKNLNVSFANVVVVFAKSSEKKMN